MGKNNENRFHRLFNNQETKRTFVALVDLNPHVYTSTYIGYVNGVLISEQIDEIQGLQFEISKILKEQKLILESIKSVKSELSELKKELKSYEYRGIEVTS